MKNRCKLWLIPILFLVSCNQGEATSSSIEISNELSSEIATSPTDDSSFSSEETKIDLEGLQNLLIGDIGVNEILKSSKVDFLEVDKRGDSRTITSRETMNIYSDWISIAKGEEESKYIMSGEEHVYSDTYERVATTINYDGQEVFYLVKDFEDGTLNLSWQDSADRLPIYKEGDPAYDGYDYLLSGSVPGQLTKQVSLIMYNYIGAYLLGNPDLQAYMPYAQIEREGSKIRYYLDNFSYNYSDDDGSNVKTELAFSLLLEDGLLVETSSLYKSTTTRGEEVYVEEDTTSYKISYEERVHSSTAGEFLNVEDYFLAEVDEVKAYIYNDEGDKEYVPLLNLPLEKFVRFEASNYAPLKSVDIEMYAYSSSNEDVIYTSNNVFETLSSGEATITLISATGVTFEVDVRVNIPEITRIKYDDSASSIEKEGSTRYIYTSTTYDKSIYVTVNPSAAKLSDIEITVSDEDVLEVTSTIGAKVIELKLVVKDTDKESVTITFTSKTNPSIKTEIEYKIKQRLSDEEMYEKLLNNSYKWTNLYNSNQYGIMTFTSRSEGKVTYFDGDEELGTTTFTYSFNGTSFNINAQNGSMFNYNSGEITLDGNQITARVNEVTYVHRYVLVEE